MTILTENNEQLVLASTFWGGDYERAGKFWVSCNAGAIRVLLPKSKRHHLRDMRTAKYVICSRGPWIAAGNRESIELLFEDDSSSPYLLNAGPESVDLMPGDPAGTGEWICSVWTFAGAPVKELELPCRWRKVPYIPWMKPWSKTP
jgi:hypothetical protein